MKTFTYLLAIIALISFIGVLAGYTHQIPITAMAGISLLITKAQENENDRS